MSYTEIAEKHGASVPDGATGMRVVRGSRNQAVKMRIKWYESITGHSVAISAARPQTRTRL